MNLYISADGGGFEYGADVVTPLCWCIKRKHTRKVWNQWRLTEAQAALAARLFADSPYQHRSHNEMVRLLNEVTA